MNQPAAQLVPGEPLSKSALEITMSYGESVLDVRHLVGQKSFVIGEGKAVDMTVSSDDLPASEFPLVRWLDGRYVLTFIGEQRGEISRNGAYHPLQWLKQTKDELPGCFRYALGDDEVATLRFGGLTITVRHVSPPDRVDDTPGQREQHYTTLLLALSVFLVLALGGGLLMSFKPEAAEVEDFWANNPRMARILGANGRKPVTAGHVVLDSAPVISGLDVQATQKAFADRAEQLKECTALMPDGAGVRATLRVTNGALDVSLEPLTRDELDYTCVEQTLRTIQLSGSGRVVYTIGVSRR